MKSDFCVAVHALVFLNHKQKMVSSEELADNICTNPVRVRKVMAKLKAFNLVETKEGNAGGYLFTEAAEAVSLRNIAEAVDTRFVETNWYSGDQDKPCLVSSGMADIMEGILDELDERCREWLEDKTIADIDRQIFGTKSLGQIKEGKIKNERI